MGVLGIESHNFKFKENSYEITGLLDLMCSVYRAESHWIEPRMAIVSRSDAGWRAFLMYVYAWQKERGWGFSTETEIHLESLTVCLSLPYLPDGHGLRSGTAVAQSIRQPSLKPM